MKSNNQPIGMFQLRVTRSNVNWNSFRSCYSLIYCYSLVTSIGWLIHVEPSELPILKHLNQLTRVQLLELSISLFHKFRLWNSNTINQMWQYRLAHWFKSVYEIYEKVPNPSKIYIFETNWIEPSESMDCRLFLLMTPAHTHPQQQQKRAKKKKKFDV